MREVHDIPLCSRTEGLPAADARLRLELLGVVKGIDLEVADQREVFDLERGLECAAAFEVVRDLAGQRGDVEGVLAEEGVSCFGVDLLVDPQDLSIESVSYSSSARDWSFYWLVCYEEVVVYAEAKLRWEHVQKR